MAKHRLLIPRLVVLLAALLLAPGSQPAVASEHHDAPAVTAEGEVRVVHVDYFERGRSETAYLLRNLASGDTFELKFERRPPRLLRTGDRINVRGRAVGRKLWVTEIVAGLDQEPTGEPAQSQIAPTAGQRSVLMMVLNMPGNPNYYSQATADSAAAKMFGAGFSVDSLYLESSFDQFGFPGPGAGDVIGPLNIPYFAGCPWPNALYWIANAADDAAKLAGIDIEAYDNKFYLIPPGSISDCGWLAVGEVGYYGSTGVYRAWSTWNDTVAFAHELGHNLGWHHAATDPDNNGTMNVEYGDTSDIMGYCCSERKFNSAHLDQIGWFDASPDDVVTVLASGSYQIAPLGSGNVYNDPQVLKIDKPDTGEVYYLSYRQKAELDANLASTYTAGVNIHRARETGIWSYFIDVLSGGESFVDSANGVTVTQTGNTAEYVTMDIAFGDCIMATPAVSLGPPNQMSSGASVVYSVSVTNQDSAGCDPTIFELIAEPEDLGGLIGTFNTPNLDLDAGATSAATLTVEADGADGGYTLWAWASDVVGGLHDDGAGSASLQIDGTPPAPPTGVTTVRKKRKGRLAVQVNWDAAIDTGSGIATYRLLRNGTLIAETGNLSYTDTSVTDGDPYLYDLTAIDNAGNESGLSDSAAYPPDGGGGDGEPDDGGGSDGGSTGGKGHGRGGKPK